MAWLIQHEFLLLALLFLIPGLVIAWFRRDLRPVIGRMSLCALPFAATECLFYPDYWEPKFLFDLVDVLGFGIEDVLFVIGLVAFTSTGYAFVARQQFSPPQAGARARGFRLLAVVLGATLIAAAFRIPMIYGSIGIMFAVSVWIGLKRHDLIAPALKGGIIAVVVYAALCWIYAALIPRVFELTWKTTEFLDLWALGLPLEELLYGLACGIVATAFYPFVWGTSFEARTQQRPTAAATSGVPL